MEMEDFVGIYIPVASNLARRWTRTLGRDALWSYIDLLNSGVQKLAEIYSWLDFKRDPREITSTVSTSLRNHYYDISRVRVEVRTNTIYSADLGPEVEVPDWRSSVEMADLLIDFKRACLDVYRMADEMERQVLRLWLERGYHNYKEVAESLGIPERAARNTITGLRKLFLGTELALTV